MVVVLINTHSHFFAYADFIEVCFNPGMVVLAYSSQHSQHRSRIPSSLTLTWTT